MALLKIERLGGFGGFGLPGSHLRSEGRIDPDALGEADRRSVEALFAKGAKSAPAPPMPDAFRYRITRITDGGEEAIEVAESEVPAALAQSVKDQLR